MLGLVKGLADRFLQLLIAAVAPVTAYRRANDSTQRSITIAIHVLFACVCLGLLVAGQIHWQLDAYVRSSLPVLRSSWLPIVGVLLYAMAWSTWFVACVLRTPAEKPLYDCVIASLRGGLDRCTQAGIDPKQKPIFLVLGSPAGGVRDFFAASHTDLVVLPSSEELDEPVQVCANHDAIYVCCRESSLLGNYTRQAARERAKAIERAGERVAGLSRPAIAAWRGQSSASGMGQAKASSVASFNQAGDVSQVSVLSSTAVASRTVGNPTSGDPVLSRVEQTLGELEALTELDANEVGDRRASSVATSGLLQPRIAKPLATRLEMDDALMLVERLGTVCRELAECRQPYCPINGVLLMVPLDATSDVETADHVGMRIERDLNAIAEATETSISAHVVFCDFESCVGSQPFIDRFPESQRHRRLGVMIPAVPVSERGAVAEIIDRSAHWICEELFSPLGFRLMMRDMKDASNDRMARQGNQQIQRLIQTMRGRRESMSRLIRRSIASVSDKVRVRGCFIAATGSAGATKHAFAEGIVPLILDIQNELQWTPERRRADRWQRNAAIATYAMVIGVSCFTTVLMLGWHR